MTDFKRLSEEMSKLKKQIKTVLDVSKYEESDADDMAGWLYGFGQVESADNMQILEEYHRILYSLSDIQSCLTYHNCPVREVSRLHENEDGRYETDSGYYYTSGSGIEFLRTAEFYNYDTNLFEEVQIWTTSRVESKDGEYYIVGYPDVKMDGLKVRLRGNKEYEEDKSVDDARMHRGR